MTNNQPAKTPANKSAATPATQPGNRIAAYLGIMLVALGLLTAVTSYSPLAGDISSEIGLTDVTYGLLGTVGPFTFAFVSLITPFVARRITLEWTIVIAAVMIGAGQVLPLLLAGTAAASLPKLLSLRQLSQWLPPLSGVVLVTTGVITLVANIL
jgi:cyanate permease